jgi:hypothetical protein
MAQCQVTLVDMEVVGVAGKTYRIACWRTNAATSALEAQIGADVDVASPGTGKQKISTGAVAWDLEAGRTYAFLIRCTDNSAIAVYTGGTAATGSIGTLLAGPPGVNNYVATAAVPAAAVALTSAAGVAECEITAIST